MTQLHNTVMLLNLTIVEQILRTRPQMLSYVGPMYSFWHRMTLIKPIEHLKKEWNSPIYAFFGPTPNIGYHKCWHFHDFRCSKKNYTKPVCRYLDKADKCLTSNLHRHAKICWGTDTVKVVMGAKSAHEAHKTIVKGILLTGKITDTFQWKSGSKSTYLSHPHTKTKTWCIFITWVSNPADKAVSAEIMRWVSENLRPFDVVNDRGFQSLMKMGCPEYYIPSPSTVACDARQVFLNARQQLSKVLQVCLYHWYNQFRWILMTY